MQEIIYESTSKLWILAPVIAIGIILYITIAIIEKQRIKLDPFEDNIEEEKLSKLILRTLLIGMALLLSFPVIYYLYAAHIALHPQGAVTYQKDGNKLVFTSHNFIINDSEFEIESESDSYYIIRKHDKPKEYFRLDKSELKSITKE
jgi:hypothetical protein